MNENQELAMIKDGYMFYCDYLRDVFGSMEKGKFTSVNLYGKSLASARSCIRHSSIELGLKIKTKTTRDGALMIVLV